MNSLKKKFNNYKKKLINLSDVSFGGFSIKEQAFFAKRLSFLIKAGVPILESLQMIRSQSKSPKLIRIFDKIVEDVSNGQYLSASLGKFKNVFGEFAINIVSVGESSGVLSENLEYLSEELKKKQILQRKVIGSLVYPVVVTLATLGITVFLMVYLFPKIMPVFLSLHVQLPLSTRILIFISNSFRDYGLYIMGAIVLFITTFIIMLKKSKGCHTLFDSMILKMPFFGKMVQYYNLANFTRTLGLLLKSGLTLTEAIPITSLTTTNLIYKRELNKLVSFVNRGEKISVHLEETPKLFPEIVTQIISVGERSGNLANSLTYVSELYDGEVDEFTKNLSSLIEPMLMVFMGILVGFIAISIITPIYGITQGLHA